MRLLKNGKKYCLVLALVLTSCRDSTPPKIEVCLGDGFGGADCIEADGSKLYRPPSQLKNYWMTSEPDEANLLSWCYDTSQTNVEAGMHEIKSEVNAHSQ